MMPSGPGTNDFPSEERMCEIDCLLRYQPETLIALRVQLLSGNFAVFPTEATTAPPRTRTPFMEP
jgi:hypothetical protein